MAKKSTPQEKKKLALELDRRNCYGESDKGSRKSIPRNKSRVNRSFRREINQSLSRTHEDHDLLQQEVSEIKREDWKKAPDRPLGDEIRRRLVKQILFRISTAMPKADRLIDELEKSLIQSEMPIAAVRKIIGLFRDIALYVNVPRANDEVFDMDVRDATMIVECLKAIQ